MPAMDHPGGEHPPLTQKLLLQAKKGDATALEALFAAAAGRVRWFVGLRMGPGLRAKMEPLDVVQETWVAALEGLEGFESQGEGSFAAWLCRIAERRLADLARRGARAKRTPPGPQHGVDVLLNEARLSATGPFSHAVRTEREDRLSSVIEGLEPADREVLLMRHFEELTLDEIAHRTAASPTAVRRRLGRVLALVGQSMEKDVENDGGLDRG